jgi:hypothetical protein
VFGERTKRVSHAELVEDGGAGLSAHTIKRGLAVLDAPWVAAEDISAAVAWLACDNARFVTEFSCRPTPALIGGRPNVTRRPS